MPRWFPAAEAADDLPLGEDGEALVEPEVLKVLVGRGNQSKVSLRVILRVTES